LKKRFLDCPIPTVEKGNITFPLNKTDVTYGESIIITCDESFSVIRLETEVRLTCEETGNFTNLKSPYVTCCKFNSFL